MVHLYLIVMKDFEVLISDNLVRVGVHPGNYLPFWKYISPNNWTGFYGELLKEIERSTNLRDDSY